jgi:phosphoglycolate phosphatase-like HAD superfamily hydrolase
MTIAILNGLLNKMMIKNILFDFDGVLAESVNVKSEAFRKLYLPYGNEIAKRVVDHHLKNGGVSRFEKIRLYHESWLGVKLTETSLNEILQNFSNLVLEAVVNTNEVSGASEFLHTYSDKYQRWIITGTPTEEMKTIAQRRKMAKYFVDIFGSPKGKIEWVKCIMDKWQIKPYETVFVGDATSDYEAAQHNGTHFVLRTHDDNKHVFKDYAGFKINDLTELEETLKIICK